MARIVVLNCVSDKNNNGSDDGLMAKYQALLKLYEESQKGEKRQSWR